MPRRVKRDRQLERLSSKTLTANLKHESDQEYNYEYIRDLSSGVMYKSISRLKQEMQVVKVGENEQFCTFQI